MSLPKRRPEDRCGAAPRVPPAIECSHLPSLLFAAAPCRPELQHALGSAWKRTRACSEVLVWVIHGGTEARAPVGPPAASAAAAAAAHVMSAVAPGRKVPQIRVIVPGIGARRVLICGEARGWGGDALEGSFHSTFLGSWARERQATGATAGGPSCHAGPAQEPIWEPNSTHRSPPQSNRLRSPGGAPG